MRQPTAAPAPASSSSQPPAGGVPGAKAPATAPTTLGDLAEQLEVALAKQAREPAGDLRRQVGPMETERAPASPAAPEGRDRPAPPLIPPAPAVQPVRESVAQIERTDDAAVIDLEARRRETQDALEDEMARLLGELTTETNRR
ncbi:hypothetical protein [Faunimonas sp. B44]|uniref:hypothetical protein n=1 Tax=Faunimonas sp. B44 TaxID=3461493 RepID=UPI004044D231